MTRDPFKVLEEALSYPIVVWQGYEDYVPESLRGRVLMERLVQVYRWASSMGADGDSLEEATDVEALIYLHTASLAVPLDRHWCKVFFYLARKYFVDEVDFLKEYGELDAYESQLLRELKEWIRRVQRGHVKEKKRGGKPVQRAEVVSRQANLEEFLAETR